MYVSVGGPYPNLQGPLYTTGYERYRERESLRRTSNRVCFTALIGIALMAFVFPEIGGMFLGSVGFPLTAHSAFNGIPPVLYYLLIGFDYIAGLALPAFIYFSAQRMPLSEGIPFGKTSVADVMLYVAFGCMVCMLANYPADLVAKLQEFFGYSGNLPTMPLNNDPAVLALYGLNVVVIPPLVEEIMFRGVILQSLRRYGDGFAVLVSAMLFGMYHGNFIQMVFAFLSGLALGFVVIRTNSLLPSILIHFINNGISYAVEMVTRFYGQNAANNVQNIATYTLMALGVVAMIVLIVQRKLRPRKQGGSILPFSTRLGAAFGNFGAVFFIIYAIAYSVVTLRYGS